MTDSPTPDDDRPRGGVTIGNVQGSIVGSIIAGGNVIQRITNIFSGDDGRDRRNQLILLDKVTQFWITGVLERSVHRESRLALGTLEQPDAVQHPWNLVADVAGQETQVLPPATRIADVFDRMGRNLLILGEPGSGKTITLLELARDAAMRARGDPLAAIPVVFNLSSWGQKRRGLLDWLVDELNEKYQIPKKVARQWLDADNLLLLLDGLDEVEPARRAACIGAINDFRGEHGLAPIAVSTRVAEYHAQDARLLLQGAVLLQPLTLDQVDHYLEASGSKLAALRTLLTRDAALQELAASPLMLSIMSLAYADTPLGDAGAPPGSESVDSRRHQLFDTYVARMFGRRARARPSDNTKTIRRLGWLSRMMQKHGHSIFMLEELQPTWLSGRRQRWMYVFGSRLLAAAVIAVAFTLTSVGAAATGFLGWEILLIASVHLIFGCLGAGFLIGLVDAFRLARATRRPTAFQRASLPRIGARIAGVSLLAAAGFVLGSSVIGLESMTTMPFVIVIALAAQDQALPALVAYPFVLILPFGLILGARRQARISTRDIRTVENLVWAWRPFAGALAVALVVAIVVFARASSARNPGAQLWDANGQRVGFLDDQEYWTKSATFNRDGSRVLTVGRRSVAMLWKSNGERIADIPNGRTVQFTPDGGLIESLGSATQVAWADLRLPSTVLRATDGQRVAAIGGGLFDVFWFSPTGERVVGKEAGQAALYDVQNGAVLARFPMIENQTGQHALEFDRLGRSFVALGPDQPVLMSSADGKAIAMLAPHEDFGGFVWSPDGSQIITFDENASHLWSSADGSLRGGLPQAQVTGAGFSPDGTRIVTRTREGALTLWDAKTRTMVGALDSFVESADDIVFSSDGTRMLAADRSKGVQLWDVVGGTLIAIFDNKKGAAHIRRFSPDGARVATTASDGTVTLWDSTSGARVATLEEKGGLDWLRYNPSAVAVYPAFIPSGNRLLTAGDDGRLRLWDGRTGKAIASMEGVLQFSRFDALAEQDSLFSAAGDVLTSLGNDHTLRLYDALTGNPRGSIAGVAGSSISHDGTRIATVTVPEQVVGDHRALSAVPLAFGLLAGIFLGLRAGVSDRKTYPNQGIWLSARNALIMGALCGFAFALIPTVAVGRVDRGTLLLMIGPLAFFGVLTFLWYGGLDALNHVVLRFALRRDLPLRSQQFLTSATDCVLLRRVGGGYIFVHRLLLEYFAALHPSR